MKKAPCGTFFFLSRIYSIIYTQPRKQEADNDVR